MTVIFESDRLLFRLFTMSDAERVYRLNKDSLVTRFTHDPVNRIEQAKELLERSILRNMHTIIMDGGRFISGRIWSLLAGAA